jgi:serine/threonine-protein kinase haspin
VKGAYPEHLLRLWDDFDEWKGSQSLRPRKCLSMKEVAILLTTLPMKDGFRNSQHFALILLPHAGCDLEARDFALTSKTHGTAWRQCASVFWQVCKALSVAEEDAGFEVGCNLALAARSLSLVLQHRDLHWGQILIKDIEVPKQLNRGPKTPVRICMDHAAHGVKATIIDLGLSRMNPMDGEEIPRYSNFDETIFQGEGQLFEVNRILRFC